MRNRLAKREARSVNETPIAVISNGRARDVCGSVLARPA